MHMAPSVMNRIYLKVALFCFCQLCLPVESRLKFRSDDSFDVFHLTHLINGHKSIAIETDMFHSGVGFQNRGMPFIKYVAEYWAKTLNVDTIVPKLVNNQLVFNNMIDAVVVPADNFSGWHMQSVGTISGTVFNEFFDFVEDWISECPGYQLWSVANSMEMIDSTTVYFRECDCHRFAQDALAKLYHLGGDFTTQQPFCRNYFPLLSNREPQKVEQYYPQLQSFYSNFRAIVEGSTVKTILVQMLKWLIGHYNPYFYICQTKLSAPYQFYYVPLVSPTFLKLPSYHTQRMLLPWQDNSRPTYCTFGDGSIENGPMLMI